MKPSGAASAARLRSCRATATGAAARVVDGVQPSTAAAITGLADDPPRKGIIGSDESETLDS